MKTLDEAAKEYAENEYPPISTDYSNAPFITIGDLYDIAKESFVLGANWQAQQGNKIISNILNELDKAKTKHPNWPIDILHQIAIVNEESGEATRAALHYMYENGKLEDLEKELIQTAAMCVRMIENLNICDHEYKSGFDGKMSYTWCAKCKTRF